jgi:uncharacterized protein YjbI with pentapeptide repeats
VKSPTRTTDSAPLAQPPSAPRTNRTLDRAREHDSLRNAPRKRKRRPFLARCCCFFVISLCGLNTPAQIATAANTRTASWVAAQLRSGHRVILNGVAITGALDLGGIERVRSIFECHDCTFSRSLSAHHVIFERTLDLSGSTFRKSVDFTGARFEGPALFRAGLSEEDALGRTPPCRFRGPASFSLTVFDDVVSFASTRFCAQADYRDARFADASFSRARFTTATFARSSFRGGALFNDAHFTHHASYEEADFRGRTDFARSEFNDGADFAATRFSEGASFLAAKFRVSQKDGADEAISLEDAVSSGDLDFMFAKFRKEIATFSGLVAAGSLVLRDAEFDPANGVNMNRMQVRDLVLDVDSVNSVNDRSEQIAVLKMIEDSAKERDDLATANDAHYRLRELKSASYSSFWGALDYVFYRGVAGYLVRPLRPLLVLVGLAAIVALFRMGRRRAQAGSPQTTTRRHQLWHATGARCATFLGCMLDTLALAGPRRGAGEAKTPPVLAERFEVVAYRLLLVCALIGLANSNPTLRQMLDSLL